MYIGQAISTALMLEGEAFVVNAQQMQERGLKIMHMHGIFYDVVTQFVCLSIDCACLYAASCHPHAKAAGVVISAIVGRGQFPL